MNDGHIPLKDIAKLNKKSFRDETGLFLIEGKKVFAEAKSANSHITQVLVTGKFLKENEDFLAEHKVSSRDLTVIADHNVERISETKTPPGIFAVVKKPEVTLEQLQDLSFIVALENVRDPGNFGTIIRTADWFGVKGIIVSETNVDPYNDKVIRSSMGSIFHLPIYHSQDFVSDLKGLKTAGFQLISTGPEGTTQLNKSETEKMCLILGNESTGTSTEIDQLADAVFAIPRFGQAESLNVAVSFGIMAHQLTQ